MRHFFEFAGGSVKQEQIVKFFLFVSPFVGDEYFLSQALKKGYVTKETKEGFSTEFPYLKIFLSQSGFGSDRLYQSFFFKLTSEGPFEYYITPYQVFALPSSSPCSSWRFAGRGRFMSEDEIKAWYRNTGENAPSSSTYVHYKRQPVLSRSVLNKLVQRWPVSATGEVLDSGNTRRIR